MTNGLNTNTRDMAIDGGALTTICSFNYMLAQCTRILGADSVRHVAGFVLRLVRGRLREYNRDKMYSLLCVPVTRWNDNNSQVHSSYC